MVILNVIQNNFYICTYIFIYIVGTPPFIKGGSWVFKIFKKKMGWVQTFPIKREVFVKKGGCFKKGGFTYFHSNPFQCYLSLNVWCACILFIYTISISIICVSQEEPSLTFTSESFLKRKDIVESKFLMSVIYSFIVIKIAAVST